MKLIATAVAVAMIGATAALAQENVIGQRQQLMKDAGAATRTGAAIAKGEAPFELEKARQVLTTYVTVAEKAVTLFPAGSDVGETTAAPAVWQDNAGFKAAFAKFEADAQQGLSSTSDLDSFKVAFGTVTKNCGGCHETFRIKKN
ncbi:MULTISPECIES: cytochrome c [Chelatococcus]|uniref:Cytochrome c556 n=1 Tax=Chelatococcus caeni TaxID=1348468 RepID=A0A840BZ52_9HYPH|nr:MULTISPECIES: cytochrome c [Chelatococcus]MBB4017843.1 cytochrome c556 [Chelatococcus caeni]